MVLINNLWFAINIFNFSLENGPWSPPMPERLFRLKMPNANSDICTLCDSNETGDLSHSLISCRYNAEAGQFLLDRLHQVLPDLRPHQVIQLDIDVAQDKQLPLVYLIGSVLSQIWDCRKQKKPCHLASIRAALEAGVNILRKSRHHKAANELCSILDRSCYFLWNKDMKQKNWI